MAAGLRGKGLKPHKAKSRQRQKQSKDPREKERLTAVSMGMSGDHTLDQIASAVGRARSSIQTWFDKFREAGLDGLLERKKAPGAAPALDEVVLEALRVKLTQGRFRTAPEVQSWLSKEYEIRLELSAIYYWLKKLERG